jgi:hypothetical protein
MNPERIPISLTDDLRSMTHFLPHPENRDAVRSYMVNPAEVTRYVRVLNSEVFDPCVKPVYFDTREFVEKPKHPLFTMPLQRPVMKLLSRVPPFPKHFSSRPMIVNPTLHSPGTFQILHILLSVVRKGSRAWLRKHEAPKTKQTQQSNAENNPLPHTSFIGNSLRSLRSFAAIPWNLSLKPMTHTLY